MRGLVLQYRETTALICIFLLRMNARLNQSKHESKLWETHTHVWDIECSCFIRDESTRHVSNRTFQKVAVPQLNMDGTVVTFFESEYQSLSL